VGSFTSMYRYAGTGLLVERLELVDFVILLERVPLEEDEVTPNFLRSFVAKLVFFCKSFELLNEIDVAVIGSVTNPAGSILNLGKKIYF